ncbi:MAG: hypothetical protein DI535_22500 [Citrobacter freundii]|nr:MAG: hypothetical protein DI535_22500 [Citrobacter freundii]
MSPRLKSISRVALVTLVLSSTVALISWKKQDGDKQQSQIQYTDTIPQQRDRKVRDLDEALNQLDKIDLKATIDQAMAGVADAMKQLDAEKLQLEVQKAMQQVDMEKVKADMEKAMKEIDFSKIQTDVQASLSQINWDDMKRNIDDAKLEMANMKKIDFEEINREIAKAQEEIKKIKPQLEKELAKAKEEIEKMRPELEKELAKAKVEIEKAKEEIREYKTFIDGLEKDGVLNTNEEYSIVHKNGKLFINDKEVSSSIYNKYKTFLDKHKKLNINKSSDSLNLSDDDDK